VLVRECGFNCPAQESSPANSLGQAARLLFHSSGLPLALHSTAVQPPFALSWETLWEKKVKLVAYSVEFDTLSPEHALLQVILHGSTGPQRRSLLWLCDASRLIDRVRNWQDFLEPVQGGLETLILLLTFDYLATELLAPVPPSLRTSLHARWNALSRTEQRHARELLLLLLQPTEGARAMLSRTDNLAHRASLLRAMLLPSPHTLCVSQQIGSRWAAPRFWAKQLSRCLRAIWRRGLGSSGF
jgi:hypothetical protein